MQRLDDSETNHLRGYELALDTYGPADSLTIQAATQLAWVHMARERPDEAERWFQTAGLGLAGADGSQHWVGLKKAFLKWGESEVARTRGDRNEVVALLGEVVSGLESLTGSRSAETTQALTQLGAAYLEVGRFVDAEACLAEAAAGVRAVYEPDAVPLIFSLIAHGHSQRMAGSYEPAEETLTEAWLSMCRRYGETSWRTLETKIRLADVWLLQGDAERARATCEQVLAELPPAGTVASSDPSNWLPQTYTEANSTYGRCLIALDSLPKGVALLEESARFHVETGITDVRIFGARALVDAYTQLGRSEDARRLWHELMDIADQYDRDGIPDLANYWRQQLGAEPVSGR
jgi:pentatricopeptide repeat protein